MYAIILLIDLLGGLKMTYAQVRKFFENKRDEECNITNELIAKGYRQKNGGYIKIAQDSGLENPSQWWHLMSYCLSKEELHVENSNYRYTPCGELLFWMAEVSGAVEKCELEYLKRQILSSDDIGNRAKWNAEIKTLCWERLCKKVEEGQFIAKI